MALATSRNSGEQLLAYRAGGAPAPHPDYPDQPLVWSCVVACRDGRVLFVFNPWRGEWELPAGMIDPGESPHDAGLREMREESSQIADALTFAGIAVIHLRRSAREWLEAGTMYRCDLSAVQPFIPNNEATAILWWDLQSPLDEPVSEVSAWLARAVLSLGD